MKAAKDDILQKLMQPGTTPETARPPETDLHHLTSLGVPLEETGQNHYRINTTDVGVFAGLSTLTRMLVNDFLEQCGLGITDVLVQRKLLPLLNPELVEAGVEWIMIYARLEATEDIPIRHQDFSQAIEVVFHSIQSARWGGVLFPEYFNQSAESRSKTALLFPFYMDEKHDYFILVEYESNGKFLRITIENARLSRIQLKHVPHRVVDNLDRFHLIPDLRQHARQIYQSILREALSGKPEFKETGERQPTLFNAIRQGGLGELNLIVFHWPASGTLLLADENSVDFSADTLFFRLVTKELLLLQDRDILNHLDRNAVVEMTDGATNVYFELSRRKSCLHVCLQERRKYEHLSGYLDRMPALKATAAALTGIEAPVRLVLIHHITAEILGFLQACSNIGFHSIDTFFVKYSGIVPDNYMETLLSLPEEKYRFYALQRIEKAGSLRGLFQLSRQYSRIDPIRNLDKDLASADYSFLDATRLAAGHVFMRAALQSHQAREKMILIEDGGYLNPLINRFCLEGKTVRETLSYFRMDPATVKLPEDVLQTSLAEWLTPIFPGGVEHTRNGYDADWEVEQQFGRLQFPVCSIALSNLKTGPEAYECALSILNAIENILNRLGLLLSRRQALMLGSRGAIGAYMLAELARRIGPGGVQGVDIAVSDIQTGPPLEVRTPDELSEAFLYNTDLFVGIIGKSILKRPFLEKLILHSRQPQLIFASGSTKTVEFSDLENWLVELQKAEHPSIDGHAIRIEILPLRDLQTLVEQGQTVRIHFPDDAAKDKDLLLLGNLTPINFLYYGIAREIIDEVLSQLLRVSAGLIRNELGGRQLPRKLLAVDHEIDVDANLL